MEFMLALLAIMGAFYFILMRPVINQQRQQRRDISSLEIGDEVLTSGGFYATVREINTFEDRPVEILLEPAPGLLLRSTAVAVTQVVRRASDALPPADRHRLSDEEPGADEDDEDEDDWDDEDEDDEDDEDDWDDEDEDDWDEDDDNEDEDDGWDEDDNDDDGDDDNSETAAPRRGAKPRR